jgi:hypothetical protein
MKWLLVAFASFLVNFSFTQEERGVEINPMNILFIGNSYTHYNNMPSLFEKLASSKKYKVNVEMSAKSNHTFKMHSNRADLYEAIKKRKWDYVVVQGFSRELMYERERIDTASLPYFRQIMDSIYSNNPCTNVILYMTWGYEHGYDKEGFSWSYNEMTERVKSGYRYLSELYQLPIVPVGDVWRKFREFHPTTSLYQEDNQHPNLYGSYLVANSFFTAIFKTNPENAFIPSRIDTLIAKRIQRTAFSVISNVLDTFNLNQNTMKFHFERTRKGEFIATGSANFPYADSLFWDLGNGIKISNSTFRWRYAKAGSYLVKLIVYENCGVREIYRRAVFKNPTPPKKKSNKPQPAKPAKPVRKV